MLSWGVFFEVSVSGYIAKVETLFWRFFFPSNQRKYYIHSWQQINVHLWHALHRSIYLQITVGTLCRKYYIYNSLLFCNKNCHGNATLWSSSLGVWGKGSDKRSDVWTSRRRPPLQSRLVTSNSPVASKELCDADTSRIVGVIRFVRRLQSQFFFFSEPGNYQFLEQVCWSWNFLTWMTGFSHFQFQLKPEHLVLTHKIRWWVI